MKREHRLVVPIAAPPEDVFAFYADRANVPLLVPACAWCTETGATAGTGVRTMSITMKNGNTSSYDVDYTIYDPPRRVASRWEQLGIAFECDMTYRATAGGCEVAYALVGTPASLAGRLSLVFLWKNVERSMVDVLARLKAILESRETSVRRTVCSSCGAPMLVGHGGVARCTYCGR